METLGPMTKIPPGGDVAHIEQWSLHRGVQIGNITDAELDRVVAPLLR